MSIKTCCNFPKLFLCLASFHGRVRELLSFLEKSRKNIFAIRLTKKNFVKHIENLPQHLSEKFIGDNSSIIDIALRN